MRESGVHPGARHSYFDVRRNESAAKPPRPEGETWRYKTGTLPPVPVFISNHQKLNTAPIILDQLV